MKRNDVHSLINNDAVVTKPRNFQQNGAAWTNGVGTACLNVAKYISVTLIPAGQCVKTTKWFMQADFTSRVK